MCAKFEKPALITKWWCYDRSIERFMHQCLFTHLCLRVHIPAETINCQNADQEDQADVPVHRVPFESTGFEVNAGTTS